MYPDSKSDTIFFASFQSEIAFHKVTDDTLDGLSEFFDDFCDKYQLPRPDEYDVQFGEGVFTVKFGGEIGTYVVNKQTPNRQIWLSSPNSGPKRYDFVDGIWVYHHTNESLHCLLSREMSQITEKEVNMRTLPFGKEWKEES
ncbi:predicted protein [Nematostella vectensis]|uniref:ferroxidase n=1 Tax=Nematostella vectensis TaxID=45351 RepID=A7SJC1_NEMVE|nr:predicted protein [Nematostella vectensis]|eukprot:XP_001628257.1 predicted protein [Nematostella vectensis]